MPTTTTRLGLVQWIGTDLPSVYRTGNTTNTNILDAAAMYKSGTLVGRPLANAVAAGTIYYATDTNTYFVGNGTTWSVLGSPSPVGTLSQYAGASDPVDGDGVSRWLICDARAINRTTYSGLFSTLGTTYGAGNGSTTFNIPDLRGRVPVGVDSGGTHLPVNHPTLGSGAGEEQHTLSTAELAAHNHGVTDPGHVHGYGGYVPLSQNPWSATSAGAGAFTGFASYAVAFNTGSATGGAFTGISTQNNGNGTSHNNLQPYLAVNHIIKVL